MKNLNWKNFGNEQHDVYFVNGNLYKMGPEEIDVMRECDRIEERIERRRFLEDLERRLVFD